MPSRKFSLVAGGPKNIEMSWSGNWKNVSIQMDGREIGTIPDKQTLNMGQQFALPDGSRLAVRLKQSAFSPALEVTRDGRPLPGSDSDPEQQIKTAAQIIWLIAGFNIILGVITLVAKIDFLQQIVDPTAIIFGVVFAILGYFVSKRSLAALALAISLFIIATILTVISAVMLNLTPSIGGIVVRIFLFIPMFQAISAMHQPRS